MSELTNLLAHARTWTSEGMLSVIKFVEKLLPAHEAEIREQAKREQMEADCREWCSLCCDGPPELLPEDSVIGSPFWHEKPRSGFCRAGFLRAAWAKAHPEEDQRG